jgi:plastocyanin
MKVLGGSLTGLGLAWKASAIAAIVLALIVGFSQWGSGVSAATTIVMVGQDSGGGVDDLFNADQITITEGDTVQWDYFAGTHNVTPFDPADFTATSITHFNAPGTTYSATLNTAKTVWYYCTLHASPSDMDTNTDGVVDGLDTPDFTAMIGSIDVQPAVTDTTGPLTSSVGASPDPTNGAASVTLTATVDDTTTGGSSILTAEYFVDVLGANGTGTAMAASDGTFDGVSENVTASVDVSALSLGSHNLFVQGQDSALNWGGADVVAFEVTAVPAGAESATITVQGGTLSVSTNPIDFGTIALSGLDQTVDTQPAAWTGTDGRGNAAGWNVTLTSTDYTAAGGTITVDNFKMKLDDINVITVSGNTAPTSQATSYQPLDNVTPLTLLSAAAGAGMGTYDFTPDGRLIVPAESAPGDYEAFMTVSINSGP